MTKILERELHHQSFQWVFMVDFLLGWLVWSPCCPRDCQGSSPAPQFKGISSLALCLLYGPGLTTLCGSREDQSLNYKDLCQQSDGSAFQHAVYVCHSFPAKKQLSYFMASVTIHSDFRAQENEICHYFHRHPFYLPWSNGAGCHDCSFLHI